MTDRRMWARGVFLTTIVTAGFALASATTAQSPAGLDCVGEVDNPTSSSAEWNRADLNNQQCAAAGLQMIQTNPAVAAATAANAAADAGTFDGDPFRAPRRWAGTRGSYETTTFKNRDGVSRAAALFGPLDLNAGPYPGVLLVCHTCGTSDTVSTLWYWAAEALAEAGYVVLYATSGGNSIPGAIDATDFFVATQQAPSPRGEFNPWHASLDRSRLGIVGHSGAGGVSLSAGHSDTRFDAVVAWDPFGPPFVGVTPRIPTMIQVGDYGMDPVPPVRPEKPTPTLPKFKVFDTVSAAGIDTMHIALRAATHLDWGPHFPPVPERTYTIHGEVVATYYTLAWLDRYLVPSRAAAALRRLTASGTDRFDRSADLYSIGAGAFDEEKARQAGNDEAGNVPITINGLRVGNLLSFQYDSKYVLNGGALKCSDMRSGC